MLQLILYYLVSHIISFLCSILEAVLLCCTPAYVALLKKKGSPAGRLLDELKTTIDKPLAAILTFNTISHTIGAAGVGASVIEVFGNKWFALSSIILTLTMLYWTEMVPKTIGALYWKSLAPISARIIKVMIWISYPFVISFNAIARLISRGKRSDRISEDDIRMALEAGASAGVIEESERDMVENIFRLGDRKVGVLMVPRVEIEWIDSNASLSEVRNRIISSKHRQFPLCDRDIDKVVGIISSRDILEGILEGKSIELRKLSSPPLFANENSQIFELLDLFKKSQRTLALVTDEYGTIQGMITMGDIFTAIVKDIDETLGPASFSEVIRVDNRSFLLDGKLPIDEFKEIFHIEHLPSEEKARYRTLSGLCMAELGSVPKRGDRFSLGVFNFEILKMRKRRVDKVLITRANDSIPLAR